jgi:hypothetical protein
MELGMEWNGIVLVPLVWCGCVGVTATGNKQIGSTSIHSDAIGYLGWCHNVEWYGQHVVYFVAYIIYHSRYFLVSLWYDTALVTTMHT